MCRHLGRYHLHHYISQRKQSATKQCVATSGDTIYIIISQRKQSATEQCVADSGDTIYIIISIRISSCWSSLCTAGDSEYKLQWICTERYRFVN